MFSASDAPSAPKPVDQIKLASAPQENTKALLSMQDYKDFSAVARAIGEKCNQTGTSFQPAAEKSITSKEIKSILQDFDISGASTGKKTDSVKSILKKAAEKFCPDNKQAEKLVKEICDRSKDDSQRDLPKESAKHSTKDFNQTARADVPNKNPKQEIKDTQKESKLASQNDKSQQHRHAYSTIESQDSHQANRRAFNTTDSHHAEKPNQNDAHRHAYSTIESQNAEKAHQNDARRHAYSTIESHNAENSHQNDAHRHAYSTIESHNASNAHSNEPHRHAYNTIESYDAKKSNRTQQINNGITREKDEPPLSMNQFATVAKQVVAEIDKTGAVTKQQLANAIENGSFTGPQAQVLAAMYRNFDTMKNLSGDQNPNEKNMALSVKDLNSYDQIAKRLGRESFDMQNLSHWATKNLASYSTDGISLSTPDIEKALGNRTTPPTDRRMLSMIEQHWSELNPMPKIAVTTESITDYIKELGNEHKFIDDVQYDCNRVAHNAQRADICHSLYGSDNPLDDIRHGTTKQGDIGDCYFEASVYAVAQSDPKAIFDMIHNDGNGKYSVTFPGHDAITVNAPTEAELGLYNRGSKHGVWASVLEKAYGQLLKDNHGNPEKTPQDLAGKGGYPELALALLTGRQTMKINLNNVDEHALGQELQSVLDCHPPRPVTTWINPSDPHDKRPQFTKDGFCEDHAYTITQYVPDASQPGGGLITVRNPWDLKHKEPTDRFETMSLAKYLRNFSGLAIG